MGCGNRGPAPAQGNWALAAPPSLPRQSCPQQDHLGKVAQARGGCPAPLGVCAALKPRLPRVLPAPVAGVRARDPRETSGLRCLVGGGEMPASPLLVWTVQQVFGGFWGAPFSTQLPGALPASPHRGCAVFPMRGERDMPGRSQGSLGRLSGGGMVSDEGDAGTGSAQVRCVSGWPRSEPPAPPGEPRVGLRLLASSLASEPEPQGWPDAVWLGGRAAACCLGPALGTGAGSGRQGA